MRVYSDDYLEWLDYSRSGGRLDFEEWLDKFCQDDEDYNEYGDDDDY